MRSHNTFDKLWYTLSQVMKMGHYDYKMKKPNILWKSPKKPDKTRKNPKKPEKTRKNPCGSGLFQKNPLFCQPWFWSINALPLSRGYNSALVQGEVREEKNSRATHPLFAFFAVYIACYIPCFFDILPPPDNFLKAPLPICQLLYYLMMQFFIQNLFDAYQLEKNEWREEKFSKI